MMGRFLSGYIEDGNGDRWPVKPHSVHAVVSAMLDLKRYGKPMVRHRLDVYGFCPPDAYHVHASAEDYRALVKSMGGQFRLPVLLHRGVQVTVFGPGCRAMIWMDDA